MLSAASWLTILPEGMLSNTFPRAVVRPIGRRCDNGASLAISASCLRIKALLGHTSRLTSAFKASCYVFPLTWLRACAVDEDISITTPTGLYSEREISVDTHQAKFVVPVHAAEIHLCFGIPV